MNVYGEIFIQLITMIIVPLVVGSLMVGIASLGDIQKLGRIGGRTLAFIFITTLIAAIIGLAAGLLIKPGGGVDASTAELAKNPSSPPDIKTPTQGIADGLLGIIPNNPIAAAASGNLLGVIVFTMIFAAAAGALPAEKRVVFVKFFEGINDASMIVIGWAMKLAPTAVFCLIASVIGRFGSSLLQGLLMFCIAVFVGLLIHVLGTYGLIVKFLCGMNPLRFYPTIAQVPLMGFSTSSSSATLPVSMEIAERELGMSSSVAGFVLPLGATMNKSGSALYKSTAVMFITQALGVKLGLSGELRVVFAALLSAMTTAGVPGSGLVSILLVLQIAGLSALAPAGIVLVVGVDRILDMARTAVNVTGNVVCATYVARREGEALHLNERASKN
jgi:Na+/H+-dicarboxylate symporter